MSGATICHAVLAQALHGQRENAPDPFALEKRLGSFRGCAVRLELGLGSVEVDMNAIAAALDALRCLRFVGTVTIEEHAKERSKASLVRIVTSERFALEHPREKAL